MNGTFWSSTALQDDPLFFIDRGKGPATAALLFPVTQLLTLQSAAGDVDYVEGRDFEVDAPAGRVIVFTKSEPGEDTQRQNRFLSHAATYNMG